MIYLHRGAAVAQYGTIMRQYPLLQTELDIPPSQLELISRPRLIERLSAGMDRRLVGESQAEQALEHGFGVG
jgi:hypothetical protein